MIGCPNTENWTMDASSFTCYKFVTDGFVNLEEPDDSLLHESCGEGNHLAALESSHELDFITGILKSERSPFPWTITFSSRINATKGSRRH